MYIWRVDKNVVLYRGAYLASVVLGILGDKPAVIDVWTCDVNGTMKKGMPILGDDL